MVLKVNVKLVCPFFFIFFLSELFAIFYNIYFYLLSPLLQFSPLSFCILSLSLSPYSHSDYILISVEMFHYVQNILH